MAEGDEQQKPIPIEGMDTEDDMQGSGTSIDIDITDLLDDDPSDLQDSKLAAAEAAQAFAASSGLPATPLELRVGTFRLEKDALEGIRSIKKGNKSDLARYARQVAASMMPREDVKQIKLPEYRGDAIPFSRAPSAVVPALREAFGDSNFGYHEGGIYFIPNLNGEAFDDRKVITGLQKDEGKVWYRKDGKSYALTVTASDSATNTLVVALPNKETLMSKGKGGKIPQGARYVLNPTPDKTVARIILGYNRIVDGHVRAGHEVYIPGIEVVVGKPIKEPKKKKK